MKQGNEQTTSMNAINNPISDNVNQFDQTSRKRKFDGDLLSDESENGENINSAKRPRTWPWSFISMPSTWLTSLSFLADTGKMISSTIQNLFSFGLTNSSISETDNLINANDIKMTNNIEKNEEVADNETINKNISDDKAIVVKEEEEKLKLDSNLKITNSLDSAITVRNNNNIAKKISSLNIRQSVFSSLQNKGYFVGPGDVYGGDYTIYKGGDPSNSHSVATIRVINHNKIAARDLLSFSRVQNQVRNILCCCYSFCCCCYSCCC